MRFQIILPKSVRKELDRLPDDVARRILARLATRNIPVLLCGMKAAPNLGPDYAAKFEAIYPELAAQFHVPLYPFFLEGMARDPALTLSDGMHPNPAGVKIIVARMLPDVKKMLAQVKP